MVGKRGAPPHPPFDGATPGHAAKEHFINVESDDCTCEGGNDDELYTHVKVIRGTGNGA